MQRFYFFILCLNMSICMCVCEHDAQNQTCVGHTIIDLEMAIIGTRPNYFDLTSRENKIKKQRPDGWQIVRET